MLSGPDALPVCSVSSNALSSLGLVCDCDKLFRFDFVICGNSLPVSFESDCVSKLR